LLLNFDNAIPDCSVLQCYSVTMMVIAIFKSSNKLWLKLFNEIFATLPHAVSNVFIGVANAIMRTIMTP
jgi:hypothetical protein